MFKFLKHVKNKKNLFKFDVYRVIMFIFVEKHITQYSFNHENV
jgi:hypothetical protein